MSTPSQLSGSQREVKTRPEPDWKRRGTRKPMTPFDRFKFLLLIAALFGVLVWNEYLQIEPLGSWGDAFAQETASQQWLLWLLGLEAVRQLHFLISERNPAYNRLWTERVFAGFERWTQRRFTAWTRFRLTRAITWVFWIVVIAIVLGKVLGTSPVGALFQAPALIWQAMPMIAQIVFIMVFGIMQFVAIFWFMSRGGVETHFPDDIETRFSDVWGQDHVVARVQENMLLLENPESIEDRGGHVPSGILLWGPPGTGKTLMAEAVAGETGKPYVAVDPGAFQAMFFGVGILKVKALFRKLRKLALRYGGVIVFFDEADSLGNRGGAVATATPAGAQSAAWDAAGCNGFGHLSGHAQEVLARAGMSPNATGPGSSRFVVPGGGGRGGFGGDMGTLQALLSELSGLKKPRGFVNRVVRRTLGMRPKPPPKYRILVMMASNQPDSLDPALLRPGRIDRIYRVGYPSKAGRIRTYQGYFDKTTHELTDEQIDKLATITPYATGATIKDLVNEALISAIRDGRETIVWKDVIRAKHLKDLGPGEDVEYVERERHATALHEACHAVLAWATRRHLDIDLATIEKGSDYLGMVKSIPSEELFTRWRSEYESDILVSVASLAGERMFFGGDSSSGVSGDLESATHLTALMESHWGMGAGISSLPALQRLGIGGGGGGPEPGRGPGGPEGDGPDAEAAKKEEPGGGALGARIERNLHKHLEQAAAILTENRLQVLALTHALEFHKTLTGEDVVAVLEGTQGPLVDGRPYRAEGVREELEEYHRTAVEAHRQHSPVGVRLPHIGPDVVPGELAVAMTGHPEGDKSTPHEEPGTQAP
ncbi:AAA family ATPase [Spongisporangium articulatum]|uniref:AAA family ATPase n=1 Tax=Spongisporangium articulatum TaxID=3362603 RepID=A0ABW8AQG5_9ACTN